MKKIMSLLLVVALISAMTVPVSADEGALGGWTDLLEFTSVNPDGSNLVKISGTEGTFEIMVDPQRRVAKVDLLISYGNGALPTYIGVDYAGSLSKLTVVDLGNNIARAYGNITYAFYASLPITIRKSGTDAAYYDILSCKISTLKVVDSQAHGTLKRNFSDSSPLTLPANFQVSGNGATDTYEYKLIPVTITDWRKYDYVTLYGSISTMALNSFRASIGNKGLPYEITYMESIPTGSDGHTDDYYSYNSHTLTKYYDYESEIISDEANSYTDGTVVGSQLTYSTVVYGGAVLYTVTIDLTGVDRTLSGDLDCFFTCIASPGLGYAFNVQNASGAVLTADTTSVSWWNRFTSFMTDLFGGDTTEAEQFENEMQQNNNALSDANDQMDAVTKPAVEDVPLDPSIYLDAEGTAQAGQIVQSLLGNELVLPMASITLIVGLAAFIIF